MRNKNALLSLFVLIKLDIKKEVESHNNNYLAFFLSRKS